ncbi:olfactory receptor 4B1-like [Ctenodactylus gundi]
MASAHNMTELIIAGLFQDPDVQRACFVLFLPVYLATVVGNGLIVGTVSVSRSLRSPMYFFLGHLSLVEICYSSTVVPKFITDLLATVKTISLKGCLAQIFFFHVFGVTEILLLVVMAYDRYVAICRPLHYMSIMRRQLCHMLVAGSWLGGLCHSTIQILITIPLPFCGPNTIDHYFCDLQPLFKLACTDTFVEGVIVLANSGLIALCSFLILVCSYIVILAHLRTCSSEGRRKALSTCASHITVVVLFFGPAIFLYMRPSSTYTEDKLVAVFYTVITPMLNPIIYTLRNAEVKIAMRRLWTPKTSGIMMVGSELASLAPGSHCRDGAGCRLGLAPGGSHPERPDAGRRAVLLGPLWSGAKPPRAHVLVRTASAHGRCGFGSLLGQAAPGGVREAIGIALNPRGERQGSERPDLGSPRHGGLPGLGSARDRRRPAPGSQLAPLEASL